MIFGLRQQPHLLLPAGSSSHTSRSVSAQTRISLSLLLSSTGWVYPSCARRITPLSPGHSHLDRRTVGDAARWEWCPIYLPKFSRTQTIKMLLLTLLVCLSPSVLAKPGEFGDDIDSDLADFDLDIVRHLKDGVFVFCTFWFFDFLYSGFYCPHRRHAGSPGRWKPY